ncbi:hypothetical protein [Winogradskyella aquimaris]|uniref:Lipoprotein n=1 Tax=Winogradskyella aquimaris TaxID=864074 RepID=A0ABU5EP01_9FLAO|nr:hypothetical protein [Winogradskyella aquimaris]MDY2586484.1 hypothetical protein [Winogradskyella aquimaris]
MKGIFCFLIFVITFSCKNEQSSTKNKEVKVNEAKTESSTKPKAKLGLEVKFSLSTKTDTDIFLRFTEAENVGYGPKDFVKKSVKGVNDLKEVAFNLPQNILPTGMRINFDSKENKGLIVNAVYFKFEGRFYSISKENIWSFFAPTKITSYNKETNTFYLNKAESEILPGFIFREALMNKLEEKIY